MTVELEQIIRKIKALQKLTHDTGFITTRSVGEILAKLSPDDLAEVGEALAPTEVEFAPKRTRRERVDSIRVLRPEFDGNK